MSGSGFGGQAISDVARQVSPIMNREIKAQFPGTVWKVEVSPGDEIERDDDLVILECMKMEIPLVADAGGRVIEVRCAEGDVVEEGQILLVVEET